MESIATLVLKIEAATPKELGEVLEAFTEKFTQIMIGILYMSRLPI